MYTCRPCDLRRRPGAPSVRRARPASRRLLAAVIAAAAAGAALAVSGGAGSAVAAGFQAHSASVAGLYGSLPPAGTPTNGGTITIGQITGTTPTDIFPIIASANASITTAGFIDTMVLPLYNGPSGATPEINYAVSLANKPTFSDGDRTVTIPMKTNYKWSDGNPVDANDLIFDIDLVKAAVKENAANWSAFTPGLIPDSIASITATGKYTVVMHLKKAYNPSFFLNDQLQGNLFPMPSTDWNVASDKGPHLDYTNPANAKKIYDYLSKLGTQVATFASTPLWKIVDGPLVMASFSATNSSYTQKVNAAFGGSPKPRFSVLSTESFTGITPQLNALRTGSLDIASIDFSQLGLVPGLRSSGYSVYGYPELGWFAALYNFHDATGHFNSIISQLYIRQALADLEDQQAYLQGVYKNAGVVAYGPVPSVPPTPFTPNDAVHTPYPFNAAAAVSLLKSHGWKVVPNGQTTCVKAGSAAGECGAGIPAGTPFKFTWFYVPATQTPSSSLESEAFASEAKQQAGIDIQLESKTFNYLTANYNDADSADAKYDNAWGVVNFGGFSDDYYPTQSTIFDTKGVYNAGGYSIPEANTLINDSVFSSNPNAVKNEASFLTANPPGLFMPNADYIYAVSKKIGGTPASFLALTQQVEFPQYWYLTK